MAVGVRGEFAGAEFASVEFAARGVQYADISAAGVLQIAGAVRAGAYVSASGAGAIGAGGDSRLTAVAKTRAHGQADFSATAAPFYAVHAAAQARWRFQERAKLSAVMAVQASGQLGFNAAAQAFDGVDANTRLLFLGETAVAVLARTDASQIWRFASHILGAALAKARSAGVWAWGGLSRPQAVHSLRAFSRVRFAAQASGLATVRGTAQAQWCFDGGVAPVAVSSATAEAQWLWGAVAVGGWRIFQAIHAWAVWRFDAAVQTQILSQLRADGSLVFMAVPVVTALNQFDAQGAVAFVGSADPGGEIYARLPAARRVFEVMPRVEGFEVPPRHAAWEV